MSAFWSVPWYDIFVGCTTVYMAWVAVSYMKQVDLTWARTRELESRIDDLEGRLSRVEAC